MQRFSGWLGDAAATGVRFVQQIVSSFRQNWGLGVLSIVLAISLWVYVTDQDNPEQTVRVPGAVPVEAVNVPSDKAVYPRLEEGVTVRVNASESVVEGLGPEDFRATIDLSQVTGEQATLPVSVESFEPRAEVIDVNPRQVTVTLENVTSRTVRVRTKLVGELPRGFDAGLPTVQPTEVLVTGPESLVDQAAIVEAEVNLTGVRTNFDQRLLLQARDEGGGDIQDVQLDPESALVRLEISQQEFSAALVVRPTVSGVPADGYNVTTIRVEPAFAVVTGPAEVFQSIDPVLGVMTEAVSIDGASADVVRTVALRLPEGASVEQPSVTVRVAIAPAQGTFGFTAAVEATNVPAGLTASYAPLSVHVVVAGTVPALSALAPEDIAATIDLSGLTAGEHDVAVTVRAPSGASVVSVTPARVQVTLR